MTEPHGTGVVSTIFQLQPAVENIVPAQTFANPEPVGPLEAETARLRLIPETTSPEPADREPQTRANYYAEV
jgi:hypothetical protein